MAQFTDIPTEIFLLFFSYFPLKALISTRGVSRHWRQAISHADILPARRALLDLYLRILASPLFIPTRPWVLSRLQYFDRKRYLDTLLKDHHYLPEDFCLWVLEWPARAVIRGSWPGLPVCGPPRPIAGDVGSIGGYNWLGSSPPRLSPLSFGRRPCGGISALCLWVGSGEVTWLSLDKRDGLRGKVYEMYADGYWTTTEDGLDDMGNVYANFIEWQKRLWEKVERKAGYTSSYSWVKIDATITCGAGLRSEREAVSYFAPPVQVQPRGIKTGSGGF